MEIDAGPSSKRPLSDDSSDDDSQAEFLSPSGSLAQLSSQQSKSRSSNNGGRGKKSTVSIASMEEAIETVANGGSPVASQTHDVAALKSEIIKLRSTISQQSTTIEKLSRQLSFVLSYLELSDDKWRLKSFTANTVPRPSAIPSARNMSPAPF